MLLAGAALSMLSSCLGIEPFKVSGQRFKDDCLEVKAGSPCIDLEAGRVEVGHLEVCVDSDPGCEKVRRVRLGGWVDLDDDGQKDEGEEIEERQHEVAEEEGSSIVSLTDWSLQTGTDSENNGDLHLCVTVERVDGSTTNCIEQVFESC